MLLKIKFVLLSKLIVLLNLNPIHKHLKQHEKRFRIIKWCVIYVIGLTYVYRIAENLKRDKNKKIASVTKIGLQQGGMLIF